MNGLSDLGDALANLTSLARSSRHRGKWEKFLSAAKLSERLAEGLAEKPSRLTEIGDFGSNPGNLRMLAYVPEELPAGAALVVVLHGCTQTAASYDLGTGWSTLADRHGFALLLPEQRRKNNPMRCFNWFKSGDRGRGDGEALSIVQMVERLVADHGLDRSRVFVTGVSAGGAMTAVMLAAYPDLFAGGAIIAGVPYGAAEGLQDAFEVIFQGRSLTPGEWGAKVRMASDHGGPWPRVAVWHGEEDRTVTPLNAEEIIKQWTDLHGLPLAPTIEDQVQGHRRRLWQTDDGRDLIEAYTIAGMAHGVPIDPSGDDGCGTPAPFIIDAGISSTFHIARSWGLTETRRAPRASAAETRARPADPKEGGDRRTGGRPIPILEEEPARPRDERVGFGPVSPSATADFKKLLAKSLGAARALASGTEGVRREGTEGSPGGPAQDGAGRGSPVAIDIPAIIATSLEAAGLLKGSAAARAAREAAKGTGSGGIDIAAILAKSFQAAGLLPPDADGEAPLGSADRGTGGTAGSPWQGEGWSVAGTPSAVDGTTLQGAVSSGADCDIGPKTRQVSRTVALGPAPKLAYARRLDLRAALNMFTTADFRVLVDGVPVDEVSAIGMDYAEADWTHRTDIDLGRFANRTVTLAFEVAANSNICLEVFAKAWIKDISLGNASAGHAASA